MPVPAQDRIWKRFRQELDLLSQLLSADYLLISQCHELQGIVATLTPQSWHDEERRAEIEGRLREIDGAIASRQQILTIV